MYMQFGEQRCSWCDRRDEAGVCEVTRSRPAAGDVHLAENCPSYKLRHRKYQQAQPAPQYQVPARTVQPAPCAPPPMASAPFEGDEPLPF